MLTASSSALAIMLTITTKVTQISLMISVALGKHQIAQQLVGYPCSVRSEKQTSVSENSFDCFWCARCTKTLSKSGFKHANCFVIPHKMPRYSGLSSIKYQFDLDKCKIWGNDIRQRNFPLSYHSSMSGKYPDFFVKTMTKTFSSRPRPFFMSLRLLETKTKVSRLHPWFLHGECSSWCPTNSVKALIYHHHNRFTALFPGPPGWAGARRELQDFMVQGKINTGRHTDHPAGRHSIQTNQCPPPPSPHIFYRLDALPAAQPTASKHWRQLAHIIR